MTARRSERGVAMVLALMAILVLSAVGVALLLTSASETVIAGSFRAREAVRYAAEAGLERVLADLSLPGDWGALLDGSVRSSFTDGPPGGTRTLADGSTIDLGQQVNLANCQRTAACSAAEMNATTADRPWGVNNPRWVLLGYAPLSALLPDASLGPPAYVVVLAGDDPAELDGDPTRDAEAGQPGAGIIALRAEAFGPRGAFSAIDVTLARPTYNDGLRQTGVRILSWREVR